MVVPKKAKNPMITGGGNMLTSTSGKSAAVAKEEARLQGLRASGAGVGGLGMAGTAAPDAISGMRSKMERENYSLSTPGGAQMGRFDVLSKIDRGPQGAYPGSAAANAMNQAHLADHYNQGTPGLNIANFGSQAEPHYGLTSTANMTGRPVSANMLSPGTMMVNAEGLTAEEGGSGQMYAISGQTLPQYRQAAARQRQRYAMRREQRGGLTEKDSDRISQIQQRVASRKATRAQGLAQMERLASRRGLLQNQQVQDAISGMRGRQQQQAEQVPQGNAFVMPIRSDYSRTSRAEQNVAKKEASQIAQNSEAAKMIGMSDKTNIVEDVSSLANNVDGMSMPELTEVAALFERKLAASLGEYLAPKTLRATNTTIDGKKTTVEVAGFKMFENIMKQMMTAIDQGDEEAVRALSRDLKVAKEQHIDKVRQNYRTLNDNWGGML